MYTYDEVIDHSLDYFDGDELAANYNLYTYPKTGVGFQTF